MERSDDLVFCLRDLSLVTGPDLPSRIPWDYSTTSLELIFCGRLGYVNGFRGFVGPALVKV